MDHLRTHLAALWVAFLCPAAVAGYAQASPPAGWTAGGSWGNYQASAANAAQWNAGKAATNVTTNVGGRAVTMAANMRMAANAGRFVAGFAWNPWWAAAGIAIPAIVTWYLQSGYKWDPDTQTWGKLDTNPAKCYTGPCYEWQHSGPPATAWHPTRDAACQQRFQILDAADPNGTFSYQSVQVDATYPMGLCKGTYTYTPTGGTSASNQPLTGQRARAVDPPTYAPTTQASMENDMATKTVPDAVANGTPVPVPVEQPVLNPDANNAPSVQRVPMGDPQPVPNTNPQKYEQPVTDVVPSPVAGDPWRVDLVPRVVTTDSPQGTQQPTTVPKEQATTNAAPRPEPPPDLCKEHPEASACAKLDTPPDAPDLPTRNVSIAITPDSGWGASTASCPAAKHVSAGGQDIPIPYDLFCTFFSGIRPVVIAVAWLIAAFMLVGAVRRD